MRGSWPLVALWLAVSLIWVAVALGDRGGWSFVVSVVGLTLGIGFGMKAAYHYGRSTAFADSIRAHDELTRGRVRAPGNGGAK